MYIMAVLCMVKIYHNRHPDINASAYTTFMTLALIIFFGMIGILESSDGFFIFMSILHLIMCFWLSVQVYNLGRGVRLTLGEVWTSQVVISDLNSNVFLNPKQPKVFGVKSSFRDIERISPLQYANLSFEKCLNNQISGFQRGNTF